MHIFDRLRVLQNRKRRQIIHADYIISEQQKCTYKMDSWKDNLTIYLTWSKKDQYKDFFLTYDLTFARPIFFSKILVEEKSRAQVWPSKTPANVQSDKI